MFGLYIIRKGYLSPFIPTKEHNLYTTCWDYVAKGIDSLSFDLQAYQLPNMLI
jgi:hypothetical protein